MDIRIRRANRDDADFLAWVMLAASRSHLDRGLWDLIIGADDVGCLDYLGRLAVAEPKSLYHYESFLIAEVGGERAAALCGFETHDGWAVVGEAMSTVQSDLGWTEAQAAASNLRVAPVWACMPDEAGADFAIENVATLPAYRRRGLASALMEGVLKEAARRGRRRAQILTYLGNQPALSAYEKLGFRVLDQKPCRELERILGAPGFVRLTRELKIV
jgi:ribosomal protein S18 acetylase RimI-like enzyme